MHSDVAYDVDECDCSLRDCSLNASIVLGEDRSEGFFLLEASMLNLWTPVFRESFCDVGCLIEKQVMMLSIAVDMAAMLSN